MSDKDKNAKVKIFVGYAEEKAVISSAIYQPILTANVDWNVDGDVNPDVKILRDDSGDNIAPKNIYYAELSGHYWVWKNYLPKTDAEYIGFCHYRRFFDFNLTKTIDIPFKPTHINDFVKMTEKYTDEALTDIVGGYDIVLPEKAYFEDSIYDQYLHNHHSLDMDLALKILDEKYPDYADTASKVMSSNGMYLCLNFVMKKELFSEYAEWMFDILTALEKVTNWQEYVDYKDVRTPAYIAERLINVWLEYNIKNKNLKVLNSTTVLLYNNDKGKDAIDEIIKKYKSDFPMLKKRYEEHFA